MRQTGRGMITSQQPRRDRSRSFGWFVNLVCIAGVRAALVVFRHCHSVTLWRDVDHVRASSSEQLAEGVIQMAVTDAAEVVERDTSEPEARRPLMTRSSILMMNVGFFGVQYSFGLTQTAVNPLFTLIGATPEE